MENKLFMVLLGCKPAGRHTEQHDIFFGAAPALAALIPAIKRFWPGAGSIHLDGWRFVTQVDGYCIAVKPGRHKAAGGPALYFLNLGGYKPGELEEFHYKFLTVAASKAEATARAKQTLFYKHTGFGTEAVSHIDDKYGLDVDDIYDIEELLPADRDFHLEITKQPGAEDELHLGYFPLKSIQ
ncbi:DUF1543 domain-containing protein [Pedobacter yulinensis]|uniref:DUF1543 domain-containing protein n=1 Tax=Pedobacter yulinensis TaxID=2126353 RepID=A0A2T3HS03_9SPHI|nr:DUF1543 domain-containing protein [Pedobacter yulinensis]PST85183.1 DUF1543 domain-containing protein [Pedobacter yulinensis]